MAFSGSCSVSISAKLRTFCYIESIEIFLENIMKEYLFEADGAAAIAVMVVRAMRKLNFQHKESEEVMNEVIKNVALNDANQACHGSMKPDPVFLHCQYVGYADKVLKSMELAMKDTSCKRR
jgi:hypothetical protein